MLQRVPGVTTSAGTVASVLQVACAPPKGKSTKPSAELGELIVQRLSHPRSIAAIMGVYGDGELQEADAPAGILASCLVQHAACVVHTAAVLLGRHPLMMSSWVLPGSDAAAESACGDGPPPATIALHPVRAATRLVTDTLQIAASDLDETLLSFPHVQQVLDAVEAWAAGLVRDEALLLSSPDGTLGAYEALQPATRSARPALPSGLQRSAQHLAGVQGRDGVQPGSPPTSPASQRVARLLRGGPQAWAGTLPAGPAALVQLLDQSWAPASVALTAAPAEAGAMAALFSSETAALAHAIGLDKLPMLDALHLLMREDGPVSQGDFNRRMRAAGALVAAREMLADPGGVAAQRGLDADAAMQSAVAALDAWEQSHDMHTLEDWFGDKVDAIVAANKLFSHLDISGTHALTPWECALAASVFCGRATADERTMMSTLILLDQEDKGCVSISDLSLFFFALLHQLAWLERHAPSALEPPQAAVPGAQPGHRTSKSARQSVSDALFSSLGQEPAFSEVVEAAAGGAPSKVSPHHPTGSSSLQLACMSPSQLFALSSGLGSLLIGIISGESPNTGGAAGEGGATPQFVTYTAFLEWFTSSPEAPLPQFFIECTTLLPSMVFAQRAVDTLRLSSVAPDLMRAVLEGRALHGRWSTSGDGQDEGDEIDFLEFVRSVRAVAHAAQRCSTEGDLADAALDEAASAAELVLLRLLFDALVRDLPHPLTHQGIGECIEELQLQAATTTLGAGAQLQEAGALDAAKLLAGDEARKGHPAAAGQESTLSPTSAAAAPGGPGFHTPRGKSGLQDEPEDPVVSRTPQRGQTPASMITSLVSEEPTPSSSGAGGAAAAAQPSAPSLDENILMLELLFNAMSDSGRWVSPDEMAGFLTQHFKQRMQEEQGSGSGEEDEGDCDPNHDPLQEEAQARAIDVTLSIFRAVDKQRTQRIDFASFRAWLHSHAAGSVAAQLL